MSLIKQHFTLNEEFQLCTITQLQHEDSNSWTWLGRELTSWNDDNNETYDLDKSVKFNRSLVNMSANWVLTKHLISASIPSEHGYVKITLENTELPLATTEQPYTTSYILSNEQVGNIWYDSKLSIDLVPDNNYKATEFIINNNIVSPSVQWIYTNETTNKTEDKSFAIYTKFEPNMPIYTAEPLCFTAEEAGSTISMRKVGSAPTVYLETSPTGEEGSWSDFTVGSTTITLANIGDKVYFRAKQDNKRFATSSLSYNIFSLAGKIAASGNLNTLLKADGSINNLTGKDMCYAYLFSGCTSLTQAPELPATTLAQACYGGMFHGCTSLTQAPELPATTLDSACYSRMFEGCTTLTQAPALPATTLPNYCYNSMFYGCTSLTNASFPNLEKETVAIEVVENQYTFMDAASNIEAACKDGILIINSTEA